MKTQGECCLQAKECPRLPEEEKHGRGSLSQPSEGANPTDTLI